MQCSHEHIIVWLLSLSTLISFCSDLWHIEGKTLSSCTLSCSKYFCSLWPDTVFVLTKIDIHLFNSFKNLGEIGWNYICLLCWLSQYALWINGQDGWKKSIWKDQCIWCRTCLAVLTLTSHDWMQWMCSGSGYHFIIPVQTMFWKTKHMKTKVEQCSHKKKITIVFAMENSHKRISSGGFCRLDTPM